MTVSGCFKLQQTALVLVTALILWNQTPVRADNNATQDVWDIIQSEYREAMNFEPTPEIHYAETAIRNRLRLRANMERLWEPYNQVGRSGMVAAQRCNLQNYTQALDELESMLNNVRQEQTRIDNQITAANSVYERIQYYPETLEGYVTEIAESVNNNLEPNLVNGRLVVPIPPLNRTHRTPFRTTVWDWQNQYSRLEVFYANDRDFSEALRRLHRQHENLQMWKFNLDMSMLIHQNLLSDYRALRVSMEETIDAMRQCFNVNGCQQRCVPPDQAGQLRDNPSQPGRE